MPLSFLSGAMASACYFVGIALLKVAGGRMPRLHGTRVVHLFVRMVTSGVWWLGAAAMAEGLAVQRQVLADLPLPLAGASFLAGLVVLPVIGCGYFRERLAVAEWACLGVLTVAALLVADGSTAAVPALSPLVLLAVAVPSLTLPIALFALGDRRPAGGAHARPLTGVAYGVGAGILIGTAEFALAALARTDLSTPRVLTSPYPYLFALAVCAGVAQLQIALQRCRMTTVVYLATVIAKTYLLAITVAVSTGLGSSPALFAAGLTLILLTLATMPRFDHPPHQPLSLTSPSGR